MDLLADLTPAQRAAASHVEGPLLILAGPGSGKTRVITRRIAYLLQQGIRPWHILAITFTNKAAGEMRRRVEALIPESKVWISTFHSFGVRILRKYADQIGLDRNFTIYDMKDRQVLIKDALSTASLDSVHFTPERVGGAISKAKNLLQSPAEYANQAHDYFGQTVAKVYPIYEQKLRAANALDFDDLLYWVARMLRQFHEIRAELDARFQYVLIDEYQDTNYAQYAIARGLSVDYPNLCVVGDPDQSIYKFRGSDIRNILDFERDFPQARVIHLGQNYRSTKAILRAADHLISHNRKRKARELMTANADGAPVVVQCFPTGEEEAAGIVTQIRQAVQAGRRKFRDHAIFLRVNALSRVLEQAFVRQGVPYQMVRGLAFFDRKENKDILAYLRLLLNPRDNLSFTRAIGEPSRGIGRVSLEHLRMHAETRDISLFEAACQANQIENLKGKAAKGILDFATLIRDLARLADGPADEVIRQVLDRSGYRNMLMESRSAEDQERLANIEELISAAHQFAAEDGTNTIASFLEHVTLVSDVDALDEAGDRVAIMTLHAAKGLEFPVVYIVAVEQNILPHERSLQDPEEMEEERRLAFVGMTRAMEELYLCHAAQREYRGANLYAIPSPFLDELPREGVHRIDLTEASGRAVRSSSGNESHVKPQAQPTAWQRWENDRRAGERREAPRAVVRKTPAAEPVPGVDYEGYQSGVLVRHQVYGLGKVMEVSGAGAMKKVKVRFAQHGDRLFVISKAPLELVQKK